MSTLYDTLEYNGTEQSFADWNFAFDVTDELGNQKADVFTATLLGTNLAAETDSPTFPFEAQITVRTNRASTDGTPNSFSDGQVMFSGKRVQNPTKATGSSQGVTYKFQGPWYDLSNTHFQQLFTGADSRTYLLPELVLNTSTTVSNGQIMISVGDQIQAILQWLLDQYAEQGMSAPYQYLGRALNNGAIDLDNTDGEYNYRVDSSTTTIDISLFSLFLPSYIAKPMTCADAIQKCLQLSPRISVSFDYSTIPSTFHATLVDNMTPVALPLFDGISHKSLSIQARDDLLVRCININYRITNQINHKPAVDYVQDKWGPNGSNSPDDPDTGLRVVVELIDLQGVNITTTTAHLDVEPILATTDSGGVDQTTKRAWWANSRGGNVAKLLTSRVRFHDANNKPTSIPDATIYDTSVTPNAVMSTSDLIAAGLCNASGELQLNRIVRGTAHAWMINPDGSPVVSKKLHISASMTYSEYSAQSASSNPDTDTFGARISSANSHEHHVDLEATNGLTQSYSTLASTTPGEAYIIGAGGIAQYLYDHLNTLQYEGEYAKVEVAFGAGVTLRNAVNFSGGATAWANMNAQPQSIRRHYGKKTTEVQIGVAKHLNSGQLSALLNMWRFRRTWYNPLLRTQNSLGESGNVDQAVTAGNANSPDGLTSPNQSSSFTYTTQPDGTSPGVVGAGLVHNPASVANNEGLN